MLPTFAKKVTVSLCLMMSAGTLSSFAEETAPAPTETGPPAAKSPSGDGDAGMYGGTFKCSDGYNPDTDPSLHPPNQSAKVRQIVNANAQKEHEEKLAREQAEGGGAPDATAAAEKPKVPGAEDKKGEPEDPKQKVDKAQKTDEKEKKDEKDKKEDKAKKEEKKDEKEKVVEEIKEKAKEVLDKLPKPPGAESSHPAYTPVQEALYLMQAKKYQESYDLLNTFLSKNKNSVDGHYLLAVTCVAMRKYADAEAHYKAVISLAPTSPQAGRASEGLKKIVH